MKETLSNSQKSKSQMLHYESIHDDYEDHYYDPWSLEFRRRFVCDVMFGNLDLNGMEVADLASGSGHNSLELIKRFPNVSVTGFDIAPKACQAYRNHLGRDAYELDLTANTDIGKNSMLPSFWVASIIV
jgi:ubiquinone/menaquinone biosynthesis C-methylase UbiE